MEPTIYFGNGIYKNGLSEEQVGKILNKFEDITDKFTLVSGYNYKSGGVYYNYVTNWLYIDYSAYRTNQLNTWFDSGFLKFNDDTFKYKCQFTSPFCQSLESNGASNEGIAQFGLYGVNTPDMAWTARKISGNVYGVACRGLFIFNKNT